MRILGYEIKRPTAYVQPPQEQHVGTFSVVKSPPRIVAADLSEFRAAVDAGRYNVGQERAMIYDYYQTALDFDMTLVATIEARLLATTGKRIQYLDAGGVPVVSADDFLQAPAFRAFVADYIMAVKFWGMGLFEFGYSEYQGRRWFTYSKVPIKHLDPYQRVVRRMQFTTSAGDESWEGRLNVRFVGQPDLGGLLLQLSMISLAKRAAMNDWASYCQLAGNNFMIIDYKGELPDPIRRELARGNLANIGRGVIDKLPNVDIETRNLSSSSQNELFEGYVKYLDDLTTRLVLGQTMTTQDGSSRAQAEVHERTQETILDADAVSVLDFLNFELYDLLPLWGLPLGGRFVYAESATLKQSRQIDVDLKLKELGYIWTMDELKSRYSL